MRRALWTTLVLPLLLAPTASFTQQPSHIAEILERFEHANLWRDHVMVVAHRGGGMAGFQKIYPENSRAAVAASIAMGAEMVELDIQRSADGVLVVIHDTWLDRTTTCRGQVKAYTLAELRRCRLVIEGSGTVTPETVPTLADMFELIRGRILINIDNKLALADIADMAALAGRIGVADQIVIKENVWNAARIAETKAVIDRIGGGAHFIPILADDAVHDTGFVETATEAFGASAAEMIAWRGTGETPDGGVLFSAKARAVAARSDWHLWSDTFAIANKPDGMLSGGRGDALAKIAPEQAWGFWVDRGATIIQTDEPRAAIAWLAANGYRRPYSEAVASQ